MRPILEEEQKTLQKPSSFMESEMVFDSEGKDEFLEQLNIIAIKMDIHKCGVLYLKECDLMLKQLDPNLRRPIGEVLQDFVIRSHKLTLPLTLFVKYAESYGNEEFRKVILKCKDTFSNPEFAKVIQRIEGVISPKNAKTSPSFYPYKKPQIIPKPCPKQAVSKPSPPRNLPPKTMNVVHVKVKIERSPPKTYSKFLTPRGTSPAPRIAHAFSIASSRTSSRGKKRDLSTSEEREVAKCTFRPNLEPTKNEYQHVQSKLKNLIFSGRSSPVNAYSGNSVKKLRQSSRKSVSRTSLAAGATGSIYENRSTKAVRPKKTTKETKGYSFYFETKKIQRRNAALSPNSSGSPKGRLKSASQKL